MKNRRYTKILLLSYLLGVNFVLNADILQTKEDPNLRIPNRRIRRNNRSQNANANRSAFLGVQRALRQSCLNEIRQLQEQIRQTETEYQRINEELLLLSDQRKESLNEQEQEHFNFLRGQQLRLLSFLNALRARLEETQQSFDNLTATPIG